MNGSTFADATETACRRGDSGYGGRGGYCGRGRGSVPAAESEMETWAGTRNTEEQESWAMTLPIKLRRAKDTRPPTRNALSNAFAHRVAKAGRYDTNGLYLQRRPLGYTPLGATARRPRRSRIIGLGSVRLVSLAEAREKAHANRKLAQGGGDP